MEGIWQLHVIQSNITDNDWIHPNAKFHYFLDNLSLCEKYIQDTNYFETSPEDCGVKINDKNSCKICMNILKERGLK